MSATVATNLETTNEGPDVGTVNVDILNDEKIDWVLVGDSAVFRILQYNTGCMGQYLPTYHR
jgi:hypothetical protein